MPVFDVDLRPEIARQKMKPRIVGYAFDIGATEETGISSMLFCIEYMLRLKGKVNEPLSYDFLVWALSQPRYQSQQWEGAPYDKVSDAYERFGVATEAAFPTSGYPPTPLSPMPTPPEQVLASARNSFRLRGKFVKGIRNISINASDAEIADIKAYLKRGVPVVVVSKWQWPDRNDPLVTVDGLKIIRLSARGFEPKGIVLVGYSEQAGV